MLRWQLNSKSIVDRVSPDSCASIENRPFAGSGHMVRNKLHWDANNAVGLPKQKNSYQSSPTFLCFGSPTASFASQYNLFRTMWPDPAKGLLVDSRPTVDWDIDGVSIESHPRCRWSVDRVLIVSIDSIDRPRMLLVYMVLVVLILLFACMWIRCITKKDWTPCIHWTRGVHTFTHWTNC